MAYNRENGQPTRNGQQKYYLPRIDLEKYNVIIDGRNFYDNPIESDIEKYIELKKVMIHQQLFININEMKHQKMTLLLN